MSLIDRIKSSLGWVSRQQRGTRSNARRTIAGISLESIGITDYVEQLRERLRFALGAGSAEEQVYASLYLLIFFGITGVGAVAFGTTLLIGLLRSIPAANSRFKSARKRRKRRSRNEDSRLWKRD